MKKILKFFFLLKIKIINYIILRTTIVKKIKQILKISKKKYFYECEASNIYSNEIDSIIKNIDQDLKKNNLKKKNFLGTNIYNNFWKNYHDKTLKGNKICDIINKNFDHNINNLKNYNENATIIKNNGIVELQNCNLDDNYVNNIHDQLLDIDAYDSHVPWQSTKNKIKLDKIKANNSNFASYDLDIIFKFEKLVKSVFNQEIISIIQSYFNCIPTIASLNLYWNFAIEKKLGPRFFHRDVDDFKIINFFIILSDTDEKYGSYSHILKSHDYELTQNILKENPTAQKYNINANDIFSLPINGYGFNNFYENIFKNHITSYYGKKGKALMADGYGLHKAVMPKKNRLMFWATFSLTKNSQEISNNLLQKKIKYSNIKNYLDDNILNRYIGRNLINFNE